MSSRSPFIRIVRLQASCDGRNIISFMYDFGSWWVGRGVSSLGYRSRPICGYRTSACGQLLNTIGRYGDVEASLLYAVYHGRNVCRRHRRAIFRM